MENTPDYYAILGVSRNASLEEIKRAYARKRREYQDDEEKSTQLNQAYAILCDPAQRSQYDVERQFGNQIEDILEKIRNCEDSEQKIKYMTELKGVYLNILKADAGNVKALSELADIEKLLGNEEQAIEYLKRLEKCVDGADKLQAYHKLGELYQKLKKTDDAIKCFYVIYKADVTYKDDILALVRLFYEEKKNIKEAIQILNDCINKSTDERYKIIYLYEAIRAVRILKNASYQKLEETLYARLGKFRTEDAESNLKNAATLVSCLWDDVDRDDFECFHRLEKIYQAYDIKNPELNEAFEALQQLTKLAETGKVHKAIDLWLEEDWTKEIREKFGRLLIKEAAEIKQSLECIKKEAQKYWNSEKEELLELEKVVEENLKASKEFNALSRDRSISASVVTMIECILLNGWVKFDDMKATFEDARDFFFEQEDKEKMWHTLRKMEEFYPICYQKIAEIFFEGKSTQELFGDAPANSVIRSTQAASKPASVNSNANKAGWIVFGYAIGGLLLVSAAPAGAFVLFVTYCYHQWLNEKDGKQKKEVDEAAKQREREKAEATRQRTQAEIEKAVAFAGEKAKEVMEKAKEVGEKARDEARRGTNEIVSDAKEDVKKAKEKAGNLIGQAKIEWGQDLNRFWIYVFRCCICYYSAATGFMGDGIIGVLVWGYLRQHLGERRLKKIALHKDRAKTGEEKAHTVIGWIITELAIPCVIVIAGIYFLGNYIRELSMWLFQRGISYLIENAEQFEGIVDVGWLMQFDLWNILNVMFGACGILGLILSFNKAISVLQDVLSRGGNSSVKIFAGVVKGIKAVGTIIILSMAYAMYTGRWMPW